MPNTPRISGFLCRLQEITRLLLINDQFVSVCHGNLSESGNLMYQCTISLLRILPLYLGLNTKIEMTRYVVGQTSNTIAWIQNV